MIGRNSVACDLTPMTHVPHIDFLAAAEYPDPPNFCRRKSAGKIAAVVNAGEVVKFSQPLQKRSVNFAIFTKPKIVYFVCWF